MQQLIDNVESMFLCGKKSMKKIKLKICGMKYSENIQEITTLKPDYLGFIFWGEIKSKI